MEERQREREGRWCKQEDGKYRWRRWELRAQQRKEEKAMERIPFSPSLTDKAESFSLPSMQSGGDITPLLTLPLGVVLL